MGMAASQARLLSITARLSNNENTGEAVSYSKQRLADQTQQITNEYNEALNATKLTVLTGFNGAEAVYEDISYNRIAGLQMAESTKQYFVTDTRGRLLVTEEIADAFKKSGGNYNMFLAQLGYSQADIYVQKNNDTGTPDPDTGLTPTQQKIHEAWDKYFKAVGIEYVIDPEHPENFDIAFFETIKFGTDGAADEDYAIGDGYAAYLYNGTWVPINYEGTTKETKDLYDYAMAITEAYLRVDSDSSTGDDNFKNPYDLEAFKSAADSSNNSALKYYRNIFDRIQQRGFITYTDTYAKAKDDDSYIYSTPEPGKRDKVAKNPLKDSYVFEKALRDGTLRLEYYSTTKKQFISTTISEDNCIQEVTDERAVAKAERKYIQDMQDIEAQDKRFDLELKKLDTEHKALETEYESVKQVVNKNVESSFKIFS